MRIIKKEYRWFYANSFYVRFDVIAGRITNLELQKFC